VKWIVLAGLMALPGAVLAQDVLAPPAALEDATTCAAFEAMDSLQRVAALSAIEPLGGEMNPADPAQSAEWVRSVAEACHGAPEKRLDAAAREALGGD